VLTGQFEGLKHSLGQYVELKKDGNTKSLINDEAFRSQCNLTYNSLLGISQYIFIKGCFRYLNSLLIGDINGDFTYRQDRRLVLFIFFIIAMVFGFLGILLPFIKRMNKEIWRTKSMLAIIPIETIMKVSRIQQYLHNQSLFSNKDAA